MLGVRVRGGVEFKSGLGFSGSRERIRGGLRGRVTGK